MDIIIEEEVLDQFIKDTSLQGDWGHKGIHNLLISIRQLGYLHRNEHQIILTSGESEANLDEEYAEYLDKRASGIKVTFEKD